MHNYGWGFGMGFGWLVPILLIVLVVYFINKNKNEKNELSAGDILDKKYANGEIDEKEYERKKEVLK